MILLGILAALACLYATLGFITAIFTAHRLARDWMWPFAFVFVIIVWPAMVFDYWTDKADL